MQNLLTKRSIMGRKSLEGRRNELDSYGPKTGRDENFISLKNDGNPSSLQERARKETTYPKNDKYVSRSRDCFIGKHFEYHLNCA